MAAEAAAASSTIDGRRILIEFKLALIVGQSHTRNGHPDVRQLINFLIVNLLPLLLLILMVGRLRNYPETGLCIYFQRSRDLCRRERFFKYYKFRQAFVTKKLHCIFDARDLLGHRLLQPKGRSITPKLC